MRLQLSTWLEVEGYLQESRGVVIPIGSTEQHGPNGLIGTDAICPETIAMALAERGDALVAPTLSIGMAQHHLGFPGSLTLRPTTLIAVIVDIVNSLARHGFERLYFLNGHGGNVPTVQTAFAELYAQSSLRQAPDSRPALRLCIVNWWQSPGVRVLSAEMFGDAEGSHATPSEVSLTYFAYPQAVKDVQMSPRVAPSGTIRDAEDYRGRFPDGRIGSDPSLAGIEEGRRLFEAAVRDTANDYARFMEAD